MRPYSISENPQLRSWNVNVAVREPVRLAVVNLPFTVTGQEDPPH